MNILSLFLGCLFLAGCATVADKPGEVVLRIKETPGAISFAKPTDWTATHFDYGFHVGSVLFPNVKRQKGWRGNLGMHQQGFIDVSYYDAYPLFKPHTVETLANGTYKWLQGEDRNRQEVGEITLPDFGKVKIFRFQSIYNGEMDVAFLLFPNGYASIELMVVDNIKTTNEPYRAEFMNVLKSIHGRRSE